MANEDSKRSTGRPIKGRSGKNPAAGKSRKRAQIEDDPIEPVNDIIAIPAALIEIRELAREAEEAVVVGRPNPLDEITGDDLKACKAIEKIKMLVDSCIQTIKTDGLKQMPLTKTDYRLMAEGLDCWKKVLIEGHALTDQDDLHMRYLMGGLSVLLTDPDIKESWPVIDPGTPEELETVATVNSIFHTEPEPINYPECEECGAKHGPDQSCFGEVPI